MLVATPLTTGATLAAKTASVTPAQRLLLLSSYIPFFLIPLVMTVDMALRVSKLVSAGARAQNTKKTR